MATKKCPTNHSCPLCDPEMARIARLDTRSLSAFNTARTESGLRAAGKDLKMSQESPEARAARLTGSLFGTTKPHAATAAPRPKPAPAPKVTMESLIKANAVGSVRELPSAGNIQPIFPERPPVAEQFVKPIAKRGELLPAPKAPSMVDIIQGKK
jgi:hypothetical protein